MILINLLPHRELQQQRRQQRLYKQLTVAVATGLALLLLCALILQHEDLLQEQKILLLQQEHAELDVLIAQKAALQKTLEHLSAQLATLQHLQQQRNAAVSLLNALAQSMPAGARLTTMRQEPHTISLHGEAASPQDIARLLSKLDDTELFIDAQLRHTTQTDQGSTFTITTAARPKYGTP